MSSSPLYPNSDPEMNVSPFMPEDGDLTGFMQHENEFQARPFGDVDEPDWEGACEMPNDFSNMLRTVDQHCKWVIT